MIDIINHNAAGTWQAKSQKSDLMIAAKALERSFLSEMLKSSGLDGQTSDFGGGIGEDQFSSFLIDAQAGAMVDAGGIGLAEQIFKSLQGKAQ